MTERREFEMTQVDLDTLLAAMKPVPYMIIGGYAPISQQENANNAWERLGNKIGFHHMTVRPNGKGDRFFTAIPKEPTPTDHAALLAECQEVLTHSNATIKALCAGRTVRDADEVVCAIDTLLSRLPPPAEAGGEG
jgi:hypothetical protein